MGKVTMQRIIVGFASILLASTPLAPALGQAAPANAFAVGTVVTDAKGGAVGTVTAVNGDIVTVHTDKLDANLSKSSFTPSEGKLLVGLTQAELNAAVEKDKAAAAQRSARSTRSTPSSSPSSSRRATRSESRAAALPAPRPARSSA